MKNTINLGSVQVKESKHVAGMLADEAGKIYHPYLHEWAHPASDLVGSKCLNLDILHQISFSGWSCADRDCDIQ